MKFARLHAFLVALALLPSLLCAAPVRDQHVTAELLAEESAIQPGRPFWVGVKLTMDEHWHTYWKNCGDACQPTSIKWTLPDGWTAGPIQWPAPVHFSISPDVRNYGYEGTALLLVQITPPVAARVSEQKPPVAASVSEQTIKANVRWLMCSDMCIPGKAELTLTLPVKNEPPAAAASAALFTTTRQRLPHTDTGWTVTTAIEGKKLALRVVPPAGFADEIPGAYFYIEDDGVVLYESDQAWKKTDTGYALDVPLAAKPELPETIRGVLVLEGGSVPPIQVPSGDGVTTRRLDGTGSPHLQPEAAGASRPQPEAALSLGMGLLLMFLGGLILNLMPCVFPVLSIKIIGFVEQAKEGHGNAKAHAAAFAAGVMVSMWILAGILIALRGQGGSQGWAFQMSNPIFVLGLIFLFLLIGLNLFGVFELGVGLTGAGGGLQAKKGLAGSFFSGLLTTVAGAPCAGPFLGTAIGFALSQPAAVGLLAFTAMGIGTALPYVVFSTRPTLLKFIPRPGPWMETMKQLMGFPMVATAAWFGASFVKLQGGGNAELRVDAMKSLLFGAVIIAIAAWVFGKWAALHRETRTRWIARVAALALLAGGAVYALQKPETVFEPWSPEKVATLRAKGSPVFVDFTAEWCAICQVNKKILERGEVAAKFREKGVTLMIADWTDQNERVGAGLKEFGREAVPLYLLYGRDPEQPPRILPQALTPGLVIEAVEQL